MDMCKEANGITKGDTGGKLALGCTVKPLESGDTCGSTFISIEPGSHTNHINCGSNAKMLQMRFDDLIRVPS
jgi:hypothetical protein